MTPGPKRVERGLLAVAILLGFASSAYARDKYPPGPPYRSCPDTLTIYDIQQPDTLLAPCHPRDFSPVSGDTVLGLKGIVIGFDAKPSAYAFYIQNSQGGPFNGVQVFTGASNRNAFPYNLAIGDSVAVYGTMQEFPSTDGTTLIEGPDVVQSTNDIIIRRISSGNPLPRFNIVDTHRLNWDRFSPGNEGERWEGSLVRLRGPLRVGRVSGFPTLPFNSFLVVHVASPAESTLIDGNTLTTLSPPAVGTILDSIQGIVNQNTTTGMNSYRVQMRHSDDLFGPFPTSLTDAYTIDDRFDGSPEGLGTSNTRVRLEFGRRVDVATAEDESHYSLASRVDGSTVYRATVEGGGGRAVLLDITSVRTDGDIETVTAVGIGSEICPACLMSSQSRVFVNGVLDVKQVQAPDKDSLAVCIDRSPFAGVGLAAGPRITVRGVGVGQFGPVHYMEDADGADRSGIEIFGPLAPIVVGNRYLIAGQIQEFQGETEIVNSVFLRDFGPVGAPAPRGDKNITVLTDTTCDPAQNIDNGEDKEGMLVKVHDLRVAERRTVGQSFLAAGPCCAFEDTILISNLNNTLSGYTPPDSGSIVDVIGILHFTNRTFRICPRSGSDIVVHGLERPPPIPMGFDFTPGTLNLTSRGKWVTGYLEPAPPLAAGDIDVSSIRLNGIVAVDPAAQTVLGDHDENGIPDLMVKFNRTAVELTVSEGDSVPVTVIGTLASESFSGADTVRVRRGMILTPLGGGQLSAGSAAQVRWETPRGIAVESVALLFSPDGGASWITISRGQPNTGNCAWTVPTVSTGRAKVAVLIESADGIGVVEGVLAVGEAFAIESTVGVGDAAPGQIALAIRGVGPNPAVGGRLRVEFALRDGSPAKLDLLDVAGRALASKQVGSFGPGRHSTDLSSGRALPPGIYFLRLTQGESEVRARAAVLR